LVHIHWTAGHLIIRRKKKRGTDVFKEHSSAAEIKEGVSPQELGVRQA
jgi:hypothetical protein